MNESEGNFPSSDPRRVGILLLPGFALMSYASAVEPLRAVNQLAERDLYIWQHVGLDTRPVKASNGLAILPDSTVGTDLPDFGRGDMLLVCAGGNPARFHVPAVLGWLRSLARQRVVLGGVSGGTYVLARAGVLSGYRCTIHWEHVPAFSEQFPELPLRRTLFEIDRDRMTCAGGIAALDMMHAVIERDHGAPLAAQVSEWFLQTHARVGSGPQRTHPFERYGITSARLMKALTFMEGRLEYPASRSKIAEVAGVSIRQIERLFSEQMATTLQKHYLKVRLERGRVLLRETTMSVMEIALATGFPSTSSFSKSFKQRYGMPPRMARQPGNSTFRSKE